MQEELMLHCEPKGESSQNLDAEDERPHDVSSLYQKVRPRLFEQVQGQERLLGPDGPLRALLESNTWSSILLYGPPGTGKTTIARICATREKRSLRLLDAAKNSPSDLRKTLEAARLEDRAPLLFIDEIHRFDRGTQDKLLPALESGAVRMIAATTHDPRVHLASALISRSHLFELNPLDATALESTLLAALAHPQVDELEKAFVLKKEGVIAEIAQLAQGDARKGLNLLEIALRMKRCSKGQIRTLAGSGTFLRHDKDGDAHYDLTSAMIKSIRASDVDATVYWTARLYDGGENPLFIARRLIIHASEDIGLADPSALQTANAAWEACHKVGRPESIIPLMHAAIHLAKAPKSVSVVQAIGRARYALASNPLQPVPETIRDNHAPDDRSLNKGMLRKSYTNPHQAPQKYDPSDYLRLELRGLYIPGENDI